MIYGLIKKALVDQLAIDDKLISPETHIEGDLELDSTEKVIIALELKKHFNVEYKFSPKDVSIQEIVATVEEMMALTTS